ncbi:minor capsid protein, partial [Pseudomonas aeruginosa]|nr:minor capsid protein [Pseudomonas aeruginosa]ELO1122333.1 minor capsid protein [Pseudomonas aeruginosa]
MATPTEADLRAIFAMRPEAAIEYLERKGFSINWNWHDVDAATHARALTVARAARLDVLQDIRDALVDNLERGGTLRDFQRNLRPILEAKGWWGRQIVVAPDGGAEVAQLGSPRRLETIYQTNMQSAYMAGRYAAAYEARETHPYWMYVAVMDSVTRPSHAALHGKVFRWDDPIWQHIMPPNGYNCRCRIVPLTAAAVRRRGLTVESSAGKTGQVTVETGVDKRTGEIREQTLTTL